MSHPDLVVLMQEMYEHTRPECGKCRSPLSCCSPEYCEMTIEYAKENWAVDLVRTNHPTLPLMGETGCTAQPHLRPLCTLHTCKINSIGSSGNPNWDDKYFKIREKIENLLEQEFLEKETNGGN